MNQRDPFNFTVKSIEEGFLEKVCVKCENEKTSVIYDDLKITQTARALDCSNSLSLNAVIDSFKD
jgi:hypothetical protein